MPPQLRAAIVRLSEYQRRAGAAEGPTKQVEHQPRAALVEVAQLAAAEPVPLALPAKVTQEVRHLRRGAGLALAVVAKVRLVVRTTPRLALAAPVVPGRLGMALPMPVAVEVAAVPLHQAALAALVVVVLATITEPQEATAPPTLAAGVGVMVVSVARVW